MKKILAFLLAVLIALGVMFNCGIKANAVIAAPAFLTYLIEACEALLAGSGLFAQSAIDNMSTTDLFEQTSLVTSPTAPPINLPADPLMEVEKNLAEYISQNPVEAGTGLLTSPAGMVAAEVLSNVGFRSWVSDNVDNVDKVVLGEGFDMKGFGAVAVYYNRPNEYAEYTQGKIVYCEYGIINPNQYFEFNNTSDGVTYRDPNYNFLTGQHLYTKVKLYGDWRYYDGTPATDMTTPSEAQTKPADIGEVDVDGTSYAVSGDGTVTVGDQTIPINEDGSVTINDNKYYPKYDLTPYDDTAVINLLNQILKQIQVTDDGNPAKDVVENAVVEVPVEIADSKLSSLEMPKSIATVFPFCIPWDFYNGVKLLAQKPKAPRFEVPFEIPAFGLFPGYSDVIVLDFADYEDAFSVVRWVTFTLFMFGLCFITFKIVKGA